MHRSWLLVLNIWLIFERVSSIPGTLETLTQAEIDAAVADINTDRSIVIPTAQKMNCLTWDSTLLSTAQTKAKTCSITDTSIHAWSYDDQSLPATLSDVVNKWAAEGFDPLSNLCTQPDDPTCQGYKAVYNDKADSFACARASCPAQTGLPDAGVLTVCEFNVPTPTGVPYVVNNQGKTCVGCIAPKATCSSNICCGIVTTSTMPATTTTPVTTKPTTTLPPTTLPTTTLPPTTLPTTTLPPTTLPSTTLPPTTLPPTTLPSTTLPPTTLPPTTSPPTTKPPTTLPSSTLPPTTLSATCADTLIPSPLTPGPCSLTLCKSEPGTYLPKCRKTCNNCDACQCTDTTNTASINCAKLVSFEYCIKYPDKMLKFCPMSCKFCSKIRSTKCPAL